MGGIALAFLAGARRLAVFVSAFFFASVAAATWVVWANPTYEFTRPEGSSSIVRLVGGSVIVLGVLAPLLLERALPHRESSPRQPSALLRVAPWAIVVVAVLAYPGSMAVGYSGFRLPGGSPPFPSTADCVVPPTDGDEVRLVLGYASFYPDAFALRDRALSVGLDGAEVAQDGCGRLRVFVDGFSSLADAEAAATTVRRQHIDVTLERDPGD